MTDSEGLAQSERAVPSSRSKAAALLAVVSILAVVGAGVCLVVKAQRGVSGRLLDGTPVTLENVSYGKLHTVPMRAWYPLLRHIPANWLSQAGWQPGSWPIITTDRDIFEFWLRFPKRGAANQPLGYAIADEDGFESLMLFDGRFSSYEPAGFGTNLIGLLRGTATFPRRSRRFSLRLYQLNGSRARVRVAEFPIRNAGFNNYPTWVAETLPIEKSTNGFVFIMIKASVGPLLPPNDLQAGTRSEFRFRVKREGQAAEGWVVKEMLIADATGNLVRVSNEDNGAFKTQFSRVENGEIICCHRWELWKDESAWKLQVHFEHPDRPGYWIEYLVRPNLIQ